jgi:hypothetical protein
LIKVCEKILPIFYQYLTVSLRLSPLDDLSSNLDGILEDIEAALAQLGNSRNIPSGDSARPLYVRNKGVIHGS